jgi:hypothetical protein
LKPPETKHLKLKRAVLVSISAYNFNLSRYIMGTNFPWQYDVWQKSATEKVTLNLHYQSERKWGSGNIAAE